DSSSMKRDGRWDSQKKLIDQIIDITTKILPEGQGVALRFINQDVDNNSNLTLAEIRNILEPMSYKEGGNTEIGTYLKSKILEPLVYSKLESKSLERPLLISVITNGMPEEEKSSEFVDAILECGNKLEDTRCEVHSWPDRDGKGRSKVSGKHKKQHEDCRIDQLDANWLRLYTGQSRILKTKKTTKAMATTRMTEQQNNAFMGVQGKERKGCSPLA
ncbi:7144_t:CDS:2, partial [Dentiscutata erythropus]